MEPITLKAIAEEAVALLKAGGYTAEQFEKNQLPDSFWTALGKTFGMKSEETIEFVKANGGVLTHVLQMTRTRVLPS